MTELTLDGEPVVFTPGETILDIAARCGIDHVGIGSIDLDRQLAGRLRRAWPRPAPVAAAWWK